MESIVQSDILDTMLTDSRVLKNFPPIHLAATKGHLLSDIVSTDDTVLTPNELDQLVYLEKVMDWHVLNARMKPDNDNSVCGSRGNIDTKMRKKMAARKEELKEMGDWLNFPMVDMVNGFGVHWYYKQTADECKLNSFSFKDAAHYALNNVTYSYKQFVELGGDYNKLMEEEAAVTQKELEVGNYVEVMDQPDKYKFINRTLKIEGIYGKLVEIGEYKSGQFTVGDHDGKLCTVEMMTPKKITRDGEETCQYKLFNVPEEVLGKVEKHWMLDQAYYSKDMIKGKFQEKYNGWDEAPEMAKNPKGFRFKDYDEEMKDQYKKMSWKPQKVKSTFQGKTVTETLSFDARLLKKRSLDVPMICMPSIFRKGEADFHCVYFEGNNAMGQLEKQGLNFATVIIVREDQKEEYAQRYYSDHTFFVALDERKKYKTKGYSAGDSKFYCYRVAEYLYDKWKTPAGRGKRRVLIMDDQMQPFTHQIPIFKGNTAIRTKGSLKVVKETYLDDGTPIEADTYEFRQTLKDETGVSMLHRGSSRFIITHAATLLYMNRVADITGAGLVCGSSDEAEVTNMPLRTNPYKNVVWLLDTEQASIDGFSSPLNPAYQAAEDTLMSQVLPSNGIRTVCCNTIRWRKPITGGGTCGRGKKGDGPKPYLPIIKYHELLRTCELKNEPILRKSPYVKTDNYSEVEAGYPFQNFKVYHRRRDDRLDTEAIEFSISGYNYGEPVHMVFRKTLEISIDGSGIKWSHPYGSRHRINLIALYALKLIEKERMDSNYQRKDDPGKLYKKGDLVLVKWADGKHYKAVIRKYNKKEKKYDVLFDDGEWDLIAPKDLKKRGASKPKRSRMDKWSGSAFKKGDRVGFNGDTEVKNIYQTEFMVEDIISEGYIVKAVPNRGNRKYGPYAEDDLYILPELRVGDTINIIGYIGTISDKEDTVGTITNIDGEIYTIKGEDGSERWKRPALEKLKVNLKF